ncbi:MAG TPA: hypothetical protein VIK18_20770 [Pirellulales bacterium]
MRKSRATGVLLLAVSLGTASLGTASLGTVARGQNSGGLLPRSTVPPPASAFTPASPYPSTSAPAVGQPIAGQPAAGNSAITNPPGATAGRWRTPGVGGGATAPSSQAVSQPGQPGSAGPISTGPSSTGSTTPIEPLRTISNPPRRHIAAVTQGPATLPNEQGQVWREYDISPYTVRVTSTNRPEQAIVDWILRDTGYEAWHSEPLGILCANRRSVKVYHTPEMQAVVADLVDRFVSSEAESQSFGLRVVTVGSPNWRSKAHPLLKPITVQTQGIQAWMLQKEDAALLIAELRKRIDFHENSAPHLLVNNGQAATVTLTRPRSYVRDIIPKPQTWPNFEPEYAQFEEGFSLELNPLLSLDGRSVDAVIKCNIDQLEKLIPVSLDVPSPAAPRQRAQLEVPQAIYCRLHERFRWPTDQVLLVGLGMVANPAPNDSHPLLKGLPLVSAPMRADLLVFVENKGRLAPPATAAPPGGPGVPQTTQRGTYRGRY